MLCHKVRSSPHSQKKPTSDFDFAAFMVVDYLFRVVHAAGTDLDGVPVEGFSVLMTFGAVLVY